MSWRATGIDVSQVQRVIDWPTVAGAGFSFAYVKATEGISYRDPEFMNHVQGARAAGLVVGAYHVLRPNDDPVAQAKNFALLAGSLELELPPVIDFELPDPGTWGRACDPKRLSPNCLLAMRTVADVWKEPILYTYPYFAKSLPACTELNEIAACWNLWIASYRDHEPTDDEQPIIPAPWSGWSFWQTSGDHGKAVPGVQGACDHDLFNGTEISLRKQVSPTDPCPPIPILPEEP